MLNTTSESGAKAHAPQWWESLVSKVPQIPLPYQDKILNTPKFKSVLDKIPSKCPFERQYWYKDTLVLFVPALCKFNPFYKSIIELKYKLLCED